jgi:excisionase family DNA binding protein
MSVDRNDPEEFLTVAEVAEMLKLNPQTVRNWIDQGSLPAIRMGRRVRIRRSDFDRVVAASATTASPAPAPSPATAPTGPAAPSTPEGPSAEDFWSGTPVGVAEPAPDEASGSSHPASLQEGQ